ncbi:transcriptional regulator [Streptantibioticus ferralitis]|uniref:Transcriptional regulator n=1 Tax=Streptantibioticus ferralitis TaxID=236510 RepID=A0ABT5Z7F8_9ACTN|nr:transcriptional regulator [Streptantibioticus ferralitis]MDF2259766.1 transcriptional regulator [Streptantibioticus ferralitis]
MAGSSGRWRNIGHYNARGIHGGRALAEGIDKMVTGIESPVDSERGLAARLRYLTASDAGYEAMDRAGVHVRPRTLIAWLAEEQTPSKANLTRLDAAYWELRRRNVVADLKRRLNKGGRGTRIEIDPVDQSRVHSRHRRDLERGLETRVINVRGNVWDRAVDAWIAGNEPELEAIWDEIIQGALGTDWDAYTYVSSVGWAA